MFLLDYTDPLIVQLITYSPFGAELRSEEACTTFPKHKMFWAIHKELGVCSEAERPRILVCGGTNAGKTGLIDAALDRDSVRPI